jgi:hypothetical protein
MSEKRIKDPVGAERRERNFYTSFWLLFSGASSFFIAMGIGLATIMDLAIFILCLMIMVIDTIILAIPDPTGKRVCASGVTGIVFWGDRTDNKKGQSVLNGEKQILAVGVMTATPQESKSIYEYMEKMDESQKESIEMLEKSAKMAPKEKSKEVAEIVAAGKKELAVEHAAMLEAVNQVEGAVVEKEGKNGKVTEFSKTLKIYTGAVKLKAAQGISGWHIMHMIGEDQRMKYEVLPQDKVGKNITLFGHLHVFFGNEYNDKLKRLSFKNPMLVFIPDDRKKMMASSSHPQVTESREYGQLILRLNREFNNYERIIEGFQVTDQYKDKLIEFLEGQLGVKGSDEKRIATAAGYPSVDAMKKAMASAKKGRGASTKGFMHKVWSNKLARYIIIIIALVIAGVITLDVMYWILHSMKML